MTIDQPTAHPLFSARGIPPTIQDVVRYFQEKGMPEPEAETFFLFYEKRGWASRKGKFFKTWKNLAYRWIASVIHQNPRLLEPIS
jgi:hypothetical protein